MPKSYMEVVYIDSEDMARKTDLGAAMDTAGATWAAFRSYRPLAVDKDRATFLLDYYNRKGDLADTICLDDRGFTAIIGEAPKADEHYVEIDEAFWRERRKAA